MIKPGDIVLQNENEVAVVLFTYTSDNKKHACTIPLLYSKEKNSPRYFHIRYISYNNKKYNTLKFREIYFYEVDSLKTINQKLLLEELVKISEFLLQIKYSVIDEELFKFIKKEISKSLKKINKNENKIKKGNSRDQNAKSLRLAKKYKNKKRY